MATKRKSQAVNPLLHRVTYSTDLARGSSHIASALSGPSMQAAIADVIAEFHRRHTSGDRQVFLELLEQELLKRGALAAADLVRAMLRLS